MQKQKINLEEILSYGETYEKNCSTISVNDALIAMKEACRQTLKLAAENAKIKIDMVPYGGNTNNPLVPSYSVNEQSILDTIKQIE